MMMMMMRQTTVHAYHTSMHCMEMVEW